MTTAPYFPQFSDGGARFSRLSSAGPDRSGLKKPISAPVVVTASSGGASGQAATASVFRYSVSDNIMHFWGTYTTSGGGGAAGSGNVYLIAFPTGFVPDVIATPNVLGPATMTQGVVRFTGYMEIDSSSSTIQMRVVRGNDTVAPDVWGPTNGPLTTAGGITLAFSGSVLLASTPPGFS